MLLPNISPPVDRREKTRQLHVKHRGPEQAYRGAVSASMDFAAEAKEVGLGTACGSCCMLAGNVPFPLTGAAYDACHKIPGCHC